MASYSSDRRSLLKIFGAIGATCAYPFASDELPGQTAPEHPHSTVAPRVADLIIPRTDSPGAIDADVPAYIDLVVARNTDQQLVMADGLRWLDTEADKMAGKQFLNLSEEEQLSILEPLCEAADSSSGLARGRSVQFFCLMKSLTADGYYTSRDGLMEELRYAGNAALPGFPPCTHEH